MTGVAVQTPTVALEDVRLLAEGLAFPEGPVAMCDGSVIVVELRGGRLTRIEPDGRVTTVCVTGGGPNGAAIGPDGAFYVCNNGGRLPGETCAPSIQRVDPVTGAVDVLYESCDSVAFSSPNDLVFDADGGFWFTDFRGGSILYARPDGSRIERVLGDADHPNGIGLSPDGGTLYWAQTFRRQVARRRVTGFGSLEATPGYDIASALYGSGTDPFALLAGLGGAQELDSLAVAADGSVCVGTLVESGITVISADGAQVVRYVLPLEFDDVAVTNICFGGQGHGTAFITLSQTGRVVSCPWPTPGLPLTFER